MQKGDYSSYYQFPHIQNPNPMSNPSSNANPGNNPGLNLIDRHQNPYASAPPFTTGDAASDYSSCPQSYPPYPQNSDPVSPPTAPSYTPTTTTASSYDPPTTTLPPQSRPSVPPYYSNGQYQAPTTQQSYYSPFDQHQTAPSYAPPQPPPSSIAPSPNLSTNSSYTPIYTSPYNPIVTIPPVYDKAYENSPKFDQSLTYFDEKFGSYNQSRSDLGSDLYGKRPVKRYDMGGDDEYGDGVYAHEGGKVEPYGASGTASKSSTWSMFDDYGRAISCPTGNDFPVDSVSGSAKIVRAVPKAETQQDVKSGVQKYRVKLLAESGGQSTMDVLCRIGLDGIRMLDPSTGQTFRIYPLENITRCEVLDSSTLAFWSKSSVDIEPRRIRLQSNRYTTNTLLDTVTAATIQIKEMGGTRGPSDSSKATEQPMEKKKGFGDWMNLIRPGDEEKDHWVPDEDVSKCTACRTHFGAFVRRHHCRNCGDIFCDKCTQGRIALTADESALQVRVCDRCLGEVTQRLSNSNEAANKPAGLQSHEDLARKLQEVMAKNYKASSVSKSNGSGKQTREVACPTCTVHLQVQVPSSGSETIECGVCQHPFLVSAH